MPANYDNAAWFYDRLSRMVFGRALIKAQASLLHLIPAHARILIAGGGTGRLMEDIGKIYPSGLAITYVEISEKMMALARQRNAGGNEVKFINNPIEEADIERDFDMVITPFLLDSLPPEILAEAFARMSQSLKPGGLWLNTDFQLTGKWWQLLLLKSMFLFFKIIGCVEVNALPLIKKQFDDNSYNVVEENLFFGDFIVTTAYRK